MTREKKKTKRTCNVLGGAINALGLNINGGIKIEKEKENKKSLIKMFVLFCCILFTK
jgi:hypothetical protein